MKDRVPMYPGRVRLTPVAGQANMYDLVRADQPTQEGTPLNKAALLTDATAAKYGLNTDATPNEVLALLAGAVLYNTALKSLPLEKLPTGAELILKESGASVAYIKLADNYMSTGFPLVGRKGSNGINVAWASSSSGSAQYLSGPLDSACVAHITKFENSIQAAIKQVNIPVFSSYNNQKTTLPRKCFAMSACELGNPPISENYADGETLPWFTVENRAKWLNGDAAIWTRSPYPTSSDQALFVGPTGFTPTGKTVKYKYIPCLCLGADTLVQTYAPALTTITGEIISILGG